MMICSCVVLTVITVGISYPEAVCGDSLVFPVREVQASWNYRSGKHILTFDTSVLLFSLSIWPQRTFCAECCQTLVSPSRQKLPLEGCCPAVCERQSAKSAPVLRTPCRLSPTGTGPRPGRSCSPCWWRCWLAEMSMLFMGPWGSSQVSDQTHIHTHTEVVHVHPLKSVTVVSSSTRLLLKASYFCLVSHFASFVDREQTWLPQHKACKLLQVNFYFYKVSTAPASFSL